MTAHDLCAFDELEPGVLREIEIRPGRTAGVVRVGDGVRIFPAVCPHRGGPLVRGRVRPRVTAASECPGERVLDATRLVLTCPWHNWEFDLEDEGQALFDRRRLRFYDGEVVDGRVVVKLPA